MHLKRFIGPVAPAALAVATILSACGGSAAPAATRGSPQQPASGASASGAELLDKLIAEARQEGELDTATTTEQTPRVEEVKNAFLKRFGLNITVNIALGDQAGKMAKLITTLDAGGRPEFDTLTGSENDLIQVDGKGYVQAIDGWDKLLPEVNGWVRDGSVTPRDVSPPPFSGKAFVWSTRSKALMYNTRLIQPDQLPKATVDLADPKYKGKFPVPPWTDTWELGTQVHTDKDAWLQTLDRIGKNAAAVLDFNPALNRLLLGEFQFSIMNSYFYWDVKAKDPKAPVALSWFSDYTPTARCCTWSRRAPSIRPRPRCGRCGWAARRPRRCGSLQPMRRTSRSARATRISWPASPSRTAAPSSSPGTTRRRRSSS
jgi:ABC-type Fe3+ transport system substrate-binding protein